MRSASIFLLEDEALVRMMIADMVGELGHRVVAEAGNIDDAGQYALMGEFDLAILDINIGGFRVDPIAEGHRRARPPLSVHHGLWTAASSLLVPQKTCAAEAGLDRQTAGNNQFLADYGCGVEPMMRS